MEIKNKNGFIAMSLIFSFFIMFVAIMIAILVNFSHTRVVVNSINDDVINQLNELPEIETPVEPDDPIESIKPDDPIELVQTFEEKVQEYLIQYAGTYKVELWGAGSTNQMNYGSGAYTAGNIYLSAGTNLIFTIGGADGYNGGATGGYPISNGSTDLRIGNNDLYSRIMVAAGGGATSGYRIGSPYGVATVTGSTSSGGGLIGIIGQTGYDSSFTSYIVYSGSGGTQFAGGAGGLAAACGTYGKAGEFGRGGNGGSGCTVLSSYSYSSGYGGGSGYYGGGGSGGSESGYWSPLGSAGGSSFISGHIGCVAIANTGSTTTRFDSNGVLCNNSSSAGYNASGYNTDPLCSEHYSGKVFSETLMIDGDGYKWQIVAGVLAKTLEPMPNPSGGFYKSGVGHSGNGYARITYIND